MNITIKKLRSILSRLILSVLMALLFHSGAWALSALEPVVTQTLPVPPAATANATRKVLVIYSYHDTLPWQAKLREALFARLQEVPAEQRPELFEERFEAHRLSPIISNKNFLALLEAKYSNVKLDLLVTENDYAFDFTKQYKDFLPTVKRQAITLTQGRDDEALVIHENASKAIDTLLQVLPNTQRVIAIAEHPNYSASNFAPYSSNVLAQFKSVQSALLAKNIQLDIWDDFSFTELYQRAQTLPKNTAILYFPVTQDRLGVRQIPRDVIQQLSRLSPVPVFVHHDSFMGAGAVGGYLINAGKVGRLIAQAVLGLPLPKTQTEIDAATKGYYFDDTQLKRWGIPDSTLPANSIIINRKVSDWYTHRWEIAAVFCALILELLLIMALSWNLRGRKEATRALAQERDLLDSRVAERTRELEESRNIADRANRAKSEFLAHMSHELRSPLNAVIGFSQVMLRAQNLPAEHHENANIIHRSGEHLLNLINNVLDFSKIEAGKANINLHDVDFAQLLDELESMLQLRAVNAGVALIFDKAPHLPRTIHADGMKLRQVLLNLLDNALKFTTAGSVILQINATENAVTQDYTLDFKISDTGAGIAPDELSQLFTVFSQTTSGREAQEGTGLGLAISQQFVRLMGGNIVVSSELGKGTTFQFSLAMQAGKGMSRHAQRDKREIVGLAPDQPIYRILAVDDKAINRQLLLKLLSPLGFDVKEASNGQEAVAIWQQWQPHLIWMDMRMPVMNGCDATKIIKSKQKGEATIIIALATNALEEEKALMLAAGCHDFIAKPFKEQAIFDALGKHLGTRYIYTHVHDSDAVTKTPLTTTQFGVMPSEWLVKLAQATLIADNEQIMLLIQDIPSTEDVLIKQLSQMIQQFQFEQILDVIEPLIGNNT